MPLSRDDYQRLRNGDGVFAWIGTVRIKPAETLIDGRSGIATVAAVTPNIAGALAIPSANGLTISHRVWEEEFGSSAKAVGSHIHVDNVDFRIDGVAPDKLDGLYSDQLVDLWMPSRGQNLEDGSGASPNLWVLARLRPGVSIDQAQTALGSSSAGLSGLGITPYTGIAPNPARGLSRIGIFLSFSAGAVFFIACINVGSFLLGRALRRSHETSLRVALGATRPELLRELFADSIVISLAGGALGLLLGILTAHALRAFLFEEDAQQLRFAPHLFPIVTTSMVCIAITILCGLMPVLATITDRPWVVLQREAGSPSKTILRLRSALVVGQIAACCMLVICTALLLAGLHSALKTQAGHLLGNPILLTVRAQTNPQVDTNYFSDVAEKTKSVAGLSPLAWTALLPGSRPIWRSFRIQQPSLQYRRVAMDIAWLTPDSLPLLDSQPIAGRMFGVNDQRSNVAVVDEEAAAQLFGRRTVGIVVRDPADRPIEIIGVIKRKLKDAKEQKRPTIFYGYIDRSEAPSTIRDVEFRVPLVPPITSIELDANIVSANYFDALHMPLIAGQKFPDARIRDRDRVGVINQEAANLYFNGKPLGAGVIDDMGVRTEIIGVVRSQVFGTFDQHAEPTIYFPMWQDCPARMTLILENPKWNRDIAVHLRHGIESVPGRAAPIVITTLDAQLAQSGLAALRISTLIGSVSAATALMLSILGLLSTQSDAERQRQREQALRILLGCQRWRIVFMVMKDAGRLALVGTVIGTFLSFVLFRVLIRDITLVTSPAFRVWLIAALLPAAAVMIATMVSARGISAISPLAITRDR